MLRRAVLIIFLGGIWIAALFSPFSAGARDEAISAVARQRINDNLVCPAIADSRDAGRCLTDKVRNWHKLKKRFLDEQRQRTRQWKVDNGQRGLTPEFKADRAEFQRTIIAERKAYNRALKKLLRAAERERKAIVNRPDRPTLTIDRARRRPSTTNKECFTGTRQKQRQCLRTTLYKNTFTIKRLSSRKNR